jgi:hypothetical protein
MSPRRQHQSAVVDGSVQHPVVVIAAPDHQLLEGAIVDSIADGSWLAEVHRGALHRINGSCRDQRRVDRGVVVGE